MVLMAIDHASFFVAGRHPAEFWGYPLPTYGAAAVPFLTRELTHLAAPGFFFLLGVGVVLLAEARRAAGWSEGRVLRFLMLRGAVLLAAQQLIENPAWLLGQTFKVAGDTSPVPGTPTAVWLHFGVLAALGVALVTAGLATRLPRWVAGLLGVAMIGLTIAVTPDATQVLEAAPAWQRLLLLPGRTGMLQVYYPFVPWCGVALLGVAYVQRLALDREAALRGAAWGALALLALFAAARSSGFGALHGVEHPGWIGVLSVTKYPPDLPFLALTLGVDLGLLALLARLPALRPLRWLEVFGATALFFYLAHLYLYFLIGVPFRGGTGYGGLYLGWGAGLVILLPLCARYLAFKRTTTPDSLWRLL